MGLFNGPRLLTVQKCQRCKVSKKIESQGVYKNTLSGAVCSATRQMSVL